MEGLELACSALPKFDVQSFREGHLTPVFFGSALTQFLRGARCSTRSTRGRPGHCPARPSREPSTRGGEGHEVSSSRSRRTWIPNHRDRIAFVRLCSGQFPARHEAVNVRERQLHVCHCADPLLCPAARDRRRSARRRHHRHSQSWHDAKSATPSPRARRSSFRASPISRPSSCVASCSKMPCRPSSSTGLQRPCRGGRDAGLPPCARIVAESSAPSVRCSSTCCTRGSRPNTVSRFGSNCP